MRHFYILVLLSALTLILSCTLRATDKASPTKAQVNDCNCTCTSAPWPAPAAPGAPTVVKVIRPAQSGYPCALQAKLGDRIEVIVQGLGSLLKGKSCSDLMLYLNDRMIPGLHPLEGGCYPQAGIVQFLLERNKDSKETWAEVIGDPDTHKRQVKVSVGFLPQGPIPTKILRGNQVKACQFKLLLYHKTRLRNVALLLASALVLFVWLCHTSEILRNSSPAVPAGQKKPYSLARSQMAFWFFLVISAFLLIWQSTREMTAIPASVLGLIGIAAGTFVGAEAIKTSKDNAAAAVAAAPAPPAPAPPAVVPVSKHFLVDVLSDDNGISFHRFQMFVWTIILGILFVAGVWHNLDMPDFDSTLLGLTGISAGTYLGFKLSS